MFFFCFEISSEMLEDRRTAQGSVFDTKDLGKYFC